MRGCFGCRIIAAHPLQHQLRQTFWAIRQQTWGAQGNTVLHCSLWTHLQPQIRLLLCHDNKETPGQRERKKQTNNGLNNRNTECSAHALCWGGFRMIVPSALVCVWWPYVCEGLGSGQLPPSPLKTTIPVPVMLRLDDVRRLLTRQLFFPGRAWRTARGRWEWGGCSAVIT